MICFFFVESNLVDLFQKFVKAHKRSERLQSTPNFQEQMVLYSLYQHSVFGDPPAIGWFNSLSLSLC